MRLSLSAVIITFVILIVFALSVPHTRDVSTDPLALITATSTPIVTVNDSYRRGTHTLSGTVLASDACATVTAAASLEGDATSSQRIFLSLLVEDDSGVCLELPTEVEFETTLEAPAEVPITVMVNGAPASTTPS